MKSVKPGRGPSFMNGIGYAAAAVLCAPVAGESLNRPDESKLSSVRFLLSPLAWLRQPALICDQRATGALSGCGTTAQQLAIVGERVYQKASP